MNKFSVYIKASHFLSISCVHVCVNVLNREGVCVRACMHACVCVCVCVCMSVLDKE